MIRTLPAIPETQFHSQVGKIPWRKEWKLTPVFLPGEFHRQRILVGYNSIGLQLDTTE